MAKVLNVIYFESQYKIYKANAKFDPGLYRQFQISIASISDALTYVELQTIQVLPI